MPVAPLRAEGLDVTLGGSPILHNVAVTAGHGDIVALVGGNESGKSTLVRALLGLAPYAGGSVELLGTPLPRFRQWSRLGYVPQRSTTNLHTTVTEPVASGTLSRRRRAARNRGLRGLLAAVDLAAPPGPGRPFRCVVAWPPP